MSEILSKISKQVKSLLHRNILIPRKPRQSSPELCCIPLVSKTTNRGATIFFHRSSLRFLLRSYHHHVHRIKFQTAYARNMQKHIKRRKTNKTRARERGRRGSNTQQRSRIKEECSLSQKRQVEHAVISSIPSFFFRFSRFFFFFTRSGVQRRE